jgi:hypothetical protein
MAALARVFVPCVIAALVAVLATACKTTPPPRWEQGGAPLAIGAARWERPKGKPIEILSDGRVFEGRREIFLVDRAGRVVDDDREPVGILLPDGFVAGPDDTYLGRVGISNAAPPDSASAWLAVMPSGEVVLFESSGDRKPGGVWTGCEGAMRRTCTLVSHMVAMRHYRDPRLGPTVGIGIGVGL